MGRLDGRAALITGASSGIGEATARAFVREGAEVTLLARRREQLESLAASLGDGAVATVADVRDPAAIAAAVKQTVDRFGRLDVVVNSAGVVHPLSLADLDADAWRETIDTNLSGSFYVAREAGLHMSENGGGSIVNVGSDLSILGMPMYVAYCASKAGVIGLTKALAAELAPKVRVNAVCPGPVDTPMLAAEFKCFPDPAAAHDVTLERLPLKRFATAEEVAGAVLYLAADASYATGTTLEFDGGSTFV
jgi:NAD(P)-dependent dehydrogenase (short-subunit alcohol dehydrogenase family)